MNLVPNLKRVIIERRKAEEISAGGIFMPEAAKEDLNEGVIVAVAEADALFKVGTYVIFNAFSGTEVIDDGLSYLVISEEDIIVNRTDV